MATIRIPSGSSADEINALIAASQRDDTVLFAVGDYCPDKPLIWIRGRHYDGQGRELAERLAATIHGCNNDVPCIDVVIDPQHPDPLLKVVTTGFDFPDGLLMRDIASDTIIIGNDAAFAAS